MNRKLANIAVIVVLVLCMVFGIAYYHTQETITLRLGIFTGSNWDVPNADSYAIFDDLIERFENKYPNVNVEYTSGITKEEYSNWLSKQALKGEFPDVMLILPEDFSTFAQVGLLHDLDALSSADATFDKDVYYRASYNSGIYKDELYALPYESVPTLMFMNKTLLEKEGIEIPGNEWTWEDFYKICKQISKDLDSDGMMDQFGVYGYEWKDAIYANGVKLFSENGEHSYVNSDHMEEAVEFVRSIHELNANIHVTSSDFDEGNVAFYPMQFSTYRAYMPYPWRVKKYSTFEWDCITLPKALGGDNVSEIETLSVGMSAQTRHKQEAWNLMKMLSCDPTTQMNIFYMSQGVSVLKEVTNSEEAMNIILQDNPGDSDFKMDSLNEVMEKGESQPNFNKYFDVVEQIDNDLYRVIRSTVNIKNELSNLQHKIEKLLRD